MNVFIKLSLLVGVLTIASSCGTGAFRSRDSYTRGRSIVRPLSLRRLQCINMFLDRDIPIERANRVCLDVYRVR